VVVAVVSWAGGELDGAGQGTGVIECVAGQSQGPDGEYSYTCTGADLTEPAPQCEGEAPFHTHIHTSGDSCDTDGWAKLRGNAHGLRQTVR